MTEGVESFEVGVPEDELDVGRERHAKKGKLLNFHHLMHYLKYSLFLNSLEILLKYSRTNSW
jgi:hypothetical protein